MKNVKQWLIVIGGSSVIAALLVIGFLSLFPLHVNRAGEMVGMLSVNGYTGQVFPHTWHGKLLKMEGAEDHQE